ncbi:MAG: ferrochelatase [Gammaproteobacteria bacterium]|nr:ferrochelatase [Gammaproteobacteria bacterium]
MSKFKGKRDHVHGGDICLGVLIVNLGTPDAPTVRAIRKYLAEFLWDSRVVELPRALWWVLLHAVVLRLRPRQKAEAYAKIWTDEGSPLLAISKKQESALQEALEKSCAGRVKVVLAMRYGQLSIASALQALEENNARRILVLPLYPQYSASTTASTFDAIAKEFARLRWLPEIRMVNNYGAEPEYIDACAVQIRSHWEHHPRSQKLLFSFHGLPKRNLVQGDPYHCECQQTARLIAERLELKDEEWLLTFQSRFGIAEWLQPYTSDTLKKLPAKGIKSVDVFCPGFSADCIETLEEIDMQNHEIFLRSGGESFNYIPALNDESVHIQALTEIISRHIQGWPEHASAPADPVDREAVRQRALQLGARQ